MEIRWRSPPERRPPRSPDAGLILIGQLHDKVVGVGRFGGLHDLLFICVQTAIADIIGNGAGEEQWFLEDKANLGAQRSGGLGSQVMPIQGNPSIAGIPQNRGNRLSSVVLPCRLARQSR